MFKDSGYKAERYSKKAETDNIDTLSEKLSLDLRKSIKSLGWYPVLSDSWCSKFLFHDVVSLDSIGAI